MGNCKSKPKNKVVCIINKDNMIENQKEIEKRRISDNEWMLINDEWYYIYPYMIKK